MLNSKKRKQFDHPVSLALTTKGMELFLNSKRGYDIFTTLDQKRNYGVQLPQFDFGTLKSLLSGHAVSKVEIPYFSFEQTKEEIPDMTRLFINYIFHQRFAGEVLKLVTDSRVFDHWMDSHKEDRYTYEFFSNPLPEEFLRKNFTGHCSIDEMQERIIELLRPHVMSEEKWSAAEQNIVVLSAKKFLKNIVNSVWFGLSLMTKDRTMDAYLESVADELWKYLKVLRKCDMIADAVCRITGEQLYLRVRELSRNLRDIGEPVTPKTAEQTEARFNLLSTMPETGRPSVLWVLDEAKVGGNLSKRLDIYIMLAGDSLNTLITSVQRFLQRETVPTDYAEFCEKYLKPQPDTPTACRTAVFLEKIFKTDDIGFSYTFLQSEKKTGLIQLRVQI